MPAADGDVPSPDELVDFSTDGSQGVGPGAGSPEPRPMGPSDSVPIFRTDLKIDKGANAGLFEVTDPVSGRHFTLYEFELSIARMLDGRRHASDVIENGVRLGIPIDLDGLYKFVRQLWRYGFLAPPGVEPVPEGDEENGWPDREKWDEATRTLFQTALRLIRQGRPHDAESYFHAVLDADPDNAEALEYLAAIERGEAVPASPIGLRAPGRAGSSAAGGRRKLVLALAAVAALAVASVGYSLVKRTAQRPAAPAPVALPAPPKPPPPPVAWRTAAVQQREHPPLGELTASDAGIVIWKKAAGVAVKEGEKIGILRTDPRRPGAKARDRVLAAPETGVLALAAAANARVASGAPLASVVDDRIWIVDAFVDGKPPAADAVCELRGDAVADRVACRLDSARPAEGGSQLMLTVKADEAPWLEKSRSLRVRIAPAGTPPEP